MSLPNAPGAISNMSRRGLVLGLFMHLFMYLLERAELPSAPWFLRPPEAPISIRRGSCQRVHSHQGHRGVNSADGNNRAIREAFPISTSDSSLCLFICSSGLISRIPFPAFLPLFRSSFIPYLFPYLDSLLFPVPPSSIALRLQCSLNY